MENMGMGHEGYGKGCRLQICNLMHVGCGGRGQRAALTTGTTQQKMLFLAYASDLTAAKLRFLKMTADSGRNRR